MQCTGPELGITVPQNSWVALGNSLYCAPEFVKMWVGLVLTGVVVRVTGCRSGCMCCCSAELDVNRKKGVSLCSDFNGMCRKIIN